MLYEVTLQGVMSGQQILNIFTYQSFGQGVDSGDATGLAAAFGLAPDPDNEDAFTPGSILRAIQDLVADDYAFSALFVRNLYDATDFSETIFSLGTTGLRSGQALPANIVFAFTSNRVRLDIRRTSKRFSGVLTSDISGTPPRFSPALPPGLFLALETALSANIVDPDTSDTYAPVILRKEPYTVPDSDPPRTAYRYYQTQAEQEMNLAIGLTFTAQSEPTTQNTRKTGRGA